MSIPEAPIEALECDYERNCTRLYKAIEAAIIEEDDDYEEIADFLETGKWEDESEPASSPEMQARTWVTRFQTVGSKKVVEWSQLPLHLAIVGGAPSNIIGSLVKLFPAALRCTDDQQMLPLHLALRHGADDEIVAYLLMQFPEAVNAKGKNGRTTVDCALRARDKIRGIILETFVEKTMARLQAGHDRVSAELTKSFDAVVAELDGTTAQLDTVNKELQDLRKMRNEHGILQTEFGSLQQIKDSMEESLTAKVQQIAQEKSEQETKFTQKIQKLESEKLTENIELQKKIDVLTAEKTTAETAEKRAVEEAETMRKELAELQQKMTATKDPSTMKAEISDMQTGQLTRSKSRAQQNIDSLKTELHGTLEKSVEKKIHSELSAIVKAVQKLERSGPRAKTTEEIDALRNEVDFLRSELRETANSSTLKMEITALRKFFEDEMKTKNIRNKSRVKSIKMVIEESSPAKLETMALVPLSGLKNKMEGIQLALRQDELLQKITKDVKVLEISLATILRGANNEAKKELEPMKSAVAGLKAYLAAPEKSKQDITSVSKDVASMMELLCTKQLQTKVTNESMELTARISMETKVSDSASQHEFETLLASVASLSDQAVGAKSTDELETILEELASIKKTVQSVAEVAKTKRELEELKASIEGELSSATATTQQELAAMRKAVDAINLEQKEGKKLKETLGSEITKATDKTQAELLDLKKSIEGLSASEIKSSDESELKLFREEMQKMKSELTKVSHSKSTDELDAVKDAIAQVRDDNETETNKKFNKLREEMNGLREGLSPTTKPKNRRFKFFSRFAGRPNLKSKAIESDENPADMILPPSMSKEELDIKEKTPSEELCQPPAVEMVQSKEHEDTLINDNEELEVTLALHKTLSGIPPPSSPSPRKKVGFLPSAMRKVRSLDPRMRKNVSMDPSVVVKSWSKTGAKISAPEPVGETRADLTAVRE